MWIPVTLFKTFTHRGWFCTIQESLGGYKIEAVAMTQQFITEYRSSSSLKYARNFKHCGRFITFKVFQLFIGYGRAIEKAKAHINQYIGDAPIS